MENLNWLIILGMFIVGFLFFVYECEEFGGILWVIAFILIVFHTVFFFVDRSEEEDWMYEVEKLHRKEHKLTEPQKDSLNELIHQKRFENRGTFSGQFMPNEIDTLSFFK